jgi:triphosphoribosyl-dephospho-CoA synthase
MDPETARTQPRPADVVAAAQLACVLEASAAKPGNVSPGRSFHDVSYEDFVASAAAIGAPLRRAASQPLGLTIRLAVEATRQWTSANTNLGIVLLLTPLVKAAAETVGDAGIIAPAALRTAVGRVLMAATVADTSDVYAAIRTAAPGGLGAAPAQDVMHEPTEPLLAAMQLAAHRDTIAREYVTSFDTTFTVGAPALEQARHDGLEWNDAVVETFLTLLAATEDTHIARRAGSDAASEVSRQARKVLGAGGVRSDTGRRAIAALDAALGDGMNARNPGTSADLTCASIYVLLMGGGWRAVERTRP